MADPQEFAHITKVKMTPSYAALVSLFGEEVEALCGFRRPPDPRHAVKPLCPECAELDDGGEIRDAFWPEMPGAPLQEADRG